MTVAAPHAPTGPAGPTVLAVTGIGLIVALLALPIVIAAGGPIEGWLLGVALWGVNWAGHLVTNRVAINLKATQAVGVTGISFISRAWLVAIVLFVVALQFSETVGLTAAAVFLVAFTTDMAGRSILYALRQGSDRDGTE